jgi:erythronate-4-phosphate dehydrogenase
VTLSILADENIPAVEHYVGALGRVERCSGRTLRSAQLADVDVLLVRSVTRVDEQLLAGSAVRFVGTATSGVDHVDQAWLQRQGIGFRHAPGSNANSVVEYVLAAIAAVGEHLEQLLAGGSVGIVGYGHIGRAVAARLQRLGIRHKVYDPWLDQHSMPQAASWDELLRCDVITLHPELTRERPWPSFHLFDARALARLQPGCLLINASRGAVVDNAALRQYLAGSAAVDDVVLDVWEGEPRVDPELLRQVRLGTAHIAGYSQDGKLLATRMLVEAMSAHFGIPWQDPGSAAGEPPVITLAQELEPAALMRHLLRCRYRIEEDDSALRKVALDDAAAAAAGFDRLRRDYPPRRELCGSRVLVAAPSDATRELLLGLGCTIQEPEP